MGDLLWLLEDPVILAPLVAAAGSALILALVLYSFRRWRAEKAIVEPEVTDAIIRTRFYALLARDGPSAISRANRRFLEQAIDRWIALRVQTWTEFQILLALRVIASRKKANPDDLLDRFESALGAALDKAPGKPGRIFALAVLNNGLATLLRMNPAIDPPARSADLGGDYSDSAYDLGLANLFDPFAIEQALGERSSADLRRLMRSAVYENERTGYTPRAGANPLMVEMVVWIVHEERFGPVPDLGPSRDHRDVLAQLLPQLPEFLREQPLRAVQMLDSRRLQVAFEQPELSIRRDSEGDMHIGIVLQFRNRFWRAVAIDLDVVAGEASLIFKPSAADRVPVQRGIAEQLHEEAPAEIDRGRLAS